MADYLNFIFFLDMISDIDFKGLIKNIEINV